MKNKHKGFTIVELVIVIAVIAVLAAVMIPTFSAIVKRSNLSADTQIVRNMNVILASESAKAAPEYFFEVKTLLGASGISELSPQTKFHTFFWIKDKNVIILADEGDNPIYPEEYLDETRNDNWESLDGEKYVELPNRGREDADESESRLFTVTVTQSGASVIIPFANIDTTAREYSSFDADIVIPDSFQEKPQRYAIQKVTAIMHDGEKEYKKELLATRDLIKTPYDDDSETFHLHIPDVTGDIEINIHIVEYCHVTVTGLTYGSHSFTHAVRKGTGLGIRLDSGRVILSAKAYRNGEFLGDLYDEKSKMIKVTGILTTEDFEIQVELEPTDQTSEATG